MLIVMRNDATPEQIGEVEHIVREMGLKPYPIPGSQRTAIGVLGNEKQVDSTPLEGLPGVINIIHVSQPYKLVGNEFKNEKTIVSVGPASIGGNKIAIMAGPCAVENRDQIIKTAVFLSKNGAHILRGGAFKPRTSPYAFQGLGKEGIDLLAEAREASGLPFVTEVIDEASLEATAEKADMLQIGARNMQNFSLLKMVGQTDKPVLLKRGMSATIKDLLMSAEYIMSEGNENIVLCERGIRTFSDASRNTLDLCSIPVIKSLSHLPVIVDPSHAMGEWDKIKPIARAGIAAGADGLMIEVHPEPRFAKSDGPQSLNFENFSDVMGDVEKIAHVMNRI
ncbi:MAG TPA: 3-deoxy-7-phosphoheptulonate synthase [bacterium]|nr:3-deoxy-7-phosphoheptulonate synthase [bacterium]